VVQELRNRCPDQLLAWIDATVILTGPGSQVFPPLLGTGGNDGRLDFSANYCQRLLEVIPATAGPVQARALAQARDLLEDTETQPLTPAAVGQFNPAAAGGPGSSRFGTADSLVNPWQYILLVEGALLFAASAVRRIQHYQPGEARAAIPFTVDHSPDGTPAGAAEEEARGELWTPQWTQPFTLPEIRQLFTEARASWRGRPARRATGFYAATRSLGVTRGITRFTRYGLQQRNGLAFTAVPLDTITVCERPEVRLAADLEDWAYRLTGDVVSGAIATARRRFEAAYLAYSRDGGPLPLARMLAALTSLEQAAGHSGRARTTLPVRQPPPAGEFLPVLAAADCPELRLATGLASCATRPATGPAHTLRHLLLPIDPPNPGSRRGTWRTTALIPGFGLRPLPPVLADVLIWRCRTAAADHQAGTIHGAPSFTSPVPVPAADVHAFARGSLDPAALDMWLRACLALDWTGLRHHWPAAGPALPVPTLGLLHPLADGLAPASTRGAASYGGEPRLGLRPDWAHRLAADQIRSVHTEAVTRLRQAGWNAVPAPPADVPGGGVLIAAALVPRCQYPLRVLRHLAIPNRPPGEAPASPDPEELP
jgi:CRISPR-associated protein Csx17